MNRFKKNYISSKLSGRVGWNFFILVLPVLLISMAMVIAFISSNFFRDSQKRYQKFYENMTLQVTDNIDQIADQYAMTFSDIALTENFLKVNNTPPGKLTNKYSYEGGDADPQGGSIRRLIMSRVEGNFFIIDFRRMAYFHKSDYNKDVVHNFDQSDVIFDLENLQKDSMINYLKKEPGSKMVIGRLSSDSASGFELDKRTTLLYPYSNDYPGDVSRLMVIVLNQTSIYRTFIENNELTKGTLYILDRFGQIVGQNHPHQNDDFQYDDQSHRYINDPELDNDPDLIMPFQEYQMLITDPSVLKTKEIQNKLQALENPDAYEDFDLNNQERSFIYRFEGRDYLVFLENSIQTGFKFIYFYPLRQISAPIIRVIWNSLIILGAGIILLIVILFWISKRFARPIEQKTSELTTTALKLAELDNMKNEFIANITHDFRSPLTIILNQADLALKGKIPLAEKTTKRFDLIRKSSIRLKDSIDRLLDLARMDSEGMKVHIRQVDIVSFLEQLSDYYRSSTTDSGVKVITEVSNEKYNDFYTDSDKLEEILNNLVSNALKFIDPVSGKIEIQLKRSGEFVVISVKDNGIGIDEKHQQRIFERFEQIDGGRNSVNKGTGIGLAFSRQLTSLLMGELTVFSSGKDQGTTFSLKLPTGKHPFNGQIMDDDLSDTVDSELRTRRIVDFPKIEHGEPIIEMIENPGENLDFHIENGLILIVDDSREIVEGVVEYLQTDGFNNFVLAFNGRDALDATYRYHPDLIISDYNMPYLRGDEFHDRLSGNPDFKVLPFIFLSALIDQRTILDRKEKGAIAYLKKPIDEKELVTIIRMHMKRHMEYRKTLRLTVMDELTGLMNRRGLMDMFYRELSGREFRDLSLLFIDLDHFKKLNDTLGHPSGDKVLKQLGRVTKEVIRPVDLAGRFGGEEFIVILPDTSLEQALIVAERLRKSVAEMMDKIDEKELSVTTSIGVASLKPIEKNLVEKLEIQSVDDLFSKNETGSEDTKQELIEAAACWLVEFADRALYKAKRGECLQCGLEIDEEIYRDTKKCQSCGSNQLKQGRNRVVYFKNNIEPHKKQEI